MTEQERFAAYDRLAKTTITLLDPVFDGPKEGDVVDTSHGRFRVVKVEHAGTWRQTVYCEPEVDPG